MCKFEFPWATQTNDLSPEMCRKFLKCIQIELIDNFLTFHSPFVIHSVIVKDKRNFFGLQIRIYKTHIVSNLQLENLGNRTWIFVYCTKDSFRYSVESISFMPVEERERERKSERKRAVDSEDKNDNV